MPMPMMDVNRPRPQEGKGEGGKVNVSPVYNRQQRGARIRNINESILVRGR